MKEHFLTYEQSLAVKELGFDEECFAYYDNEKAIRFTNIVKQNTNSFWHGNAITSPLKSQFYKWLREVHKINSIIDFSYTLKTYGYVFLDEDGNEIEVYKKNGKLFDSYEHAEDVCINHIITGLKKINL